MCVFVCVCMYACVFIKLHITAQFGTVILVIPYICHSHWSSQGGINDTVCVCVCVVIPFILDVKLVDARAGVTQEEGHTQDFPTFLSRCLPYFFSREGFSHPFPSSTVKSNILFLRNNRSPLVGHDVRKNPSSYTSTYCTFSPLRQGGAAAMRG